MPIEVNQATEDGQRLEKKTLLLTKSETMPERVQDNIIKTAILEEKMIAMTRSMDNHVKENRQDNKEVHKRISDLRDEIKDDLKV